MRMFLEVTTCKPLLDKRNVFAILPLKTSGTSTLGFNTTPSSRSFEGTARLGLGCHPPMLRRIDDRPVVTCMIQCSGLRCGEGWTIKYSTSKIFTSRVRLNNRLPVLAYPLFSNVRTTLCTGQTVARHAG